MTTMQQSSSAQGSARNSDAVTREIIRNAFISTVRQAGRIILRSSFSPIIRDAFDFCVTLVSPLRPPALNLDVVAMNESLAHFSGVMPFLVRNLLWEYGIENLEDGDVLAINNPYKGGNHVYDNCFFKPIFYKGQMIAAVAAKCHLMDLGGAQAGGYSAEKSTVWEDGVILSGVPVYKKNKPYAPGFDLYFDNSRLPENMLADIQAAFNACRFAEERFLALVEKYGVDEVLGAMQYSLEYADRSMRKAISKFPDGDYEGEDGMDADEVGGTPYRILVKIRKRADRIELDFSGTSRQSPYSINCSAYDAANGAYTALKFLFDSGNPNNSGAFRCVDVVIPEGTIISALPPAATTLYWEGAEAVFNAVVKALNNGLGQDAFGGHYGTNMALLATGPLSDGDASRIYVAPLFCLGAFGASRSGDGEAFISMSQQNIMDQSIEATEDDFPFVILRKEFIADTSGAGQFRGGPSVVWDRVLLRAAEVRPLVLHQGFLPWGAWGGQEGTTGGGWHIPAQEPLQWVRQRRVPVDRGGLARDFYQKHSQPLMGFYDPETNEARSIKNGGKWNLGSRRFTAAPGSLLRMITPSGGGWGDPLHRDPHAVLKDVRDGYLSAEVARRDYGVVLMGDADSSPQDLSVDARATEALRTGGSR
jgi:N-methylhydantoinase B